MAYNRRNLLGIALRCMIVFFLSYVISYSNLENLKCRSFVMMCRAFNLSGILIMYACFCHLFIRLFVSESGVTVVLLVCSHHLYGPSQQYSGGQSSL
jgi:hypothetical protein